MASPTTQNTADATATSPDAPAVPDDGKPATTTRRRTRPAAPASAESAPASAPAAFALPAGTKPAGVIADYLHAKATADTDAAARELPSITHAGKAIVHARWLHAWMLDQYGAAVPKSAATDTLRAAGFKARSLPFAGLPNGQTRMAVFVGDAPRGTSDIARQPKPERGTRAPAAPPSEAATKALAKATKAALGALAPLPANEHAWAVRRLAATLRAAKEA